MKKYVLSLLVAAAAASPGAAQTYRYIDESGNIHFVDRLSEVPAQYRVQLFPTPTPMNPKDLRKYQKEQERAKKKKEKELQKEQRRLQKEKEKADREEARKNKGVKKGLPGALKRSTPTPSAGALPMTPAEGGVPAAEPVATPPVTPAIK